VVAQWSPKCKGKHTSDIELVNVCVEPATSLSLLLLLLLLCLSCIINTWSDLYSRHFWQWMNSLPPAVWHSRVQSIPGQELRSLRQHPAQLPPPQPHRHHVCTVLIMKIKLF